MVKQSFIRLLQESQARAGLHRLLLDGVDHFVPETVVIETVTKCKKGRERVKFTFEAERSE